MAGSGGVEVVVLHSALGLTSGVRAVADALRAVGHAVTVPDYYAGAVFTDPTAGIAHRDAVGYDALFSRVAEAVADAPDDAAFVGFSLGASLAQLLVGRRPASRGCVLVGNTNPVRRAWSGVDVQVHRFAEDPWVDESDVRDLVAAVRESGASFEEFVTPGSGHLFTETHLPEYDPELADVFVARIHDLFTRAA